MVDDPKLLVERVQTGVRMEKRLLKVLKAFAEYHDMTLGDLLEGIVLHAFDGKTPFSPASLERIQELKRFYDFDLGFQRQPSAEGNQGAAGAEAECGEIVKNCSNRPRTEMPAPEGALTLMQFRHG